MDVWAENGDVRAEWNKYIFYTLHQKDVDQSKWQDNLDNYEEATSLAREALENSGHIHQHKNGQWF